MSVELLKILRIINRPVYFSDHKYFVNLYEKFVKKEIDFVNGSVNGVTLEPNLVKNLTNWEYWSTYEKFYDGYLYIKENFIFIDLVIFNGHLRHGARTSARWLATFKITENVLRLFEKEINKGFEQEIERVYYEELKIKKNSALEEIRHRLLK